MQRLLSSLLLGVLLVACAEPPPPPRTAVFLHWPESARPVTILASVCLTEVYDAVEFWAEHGVWYLDVKEVAVVFAPKYREITISRGELEPGTLAQTNRWYFAGNFAMSSAEIVLAPETPCMAPNLAHEIGHALGLEDVYDLARPTEIMFGALDPDKPPPLESFQVSPDQEELVR